MCYLCALQSERCTVANTSLVEDRSSISARSARKIALRVLAAIVLAHRTGRAAAIGELRLHLFSLNPEISLEALSIGNNISEPRIMPGADCAIRRGAQLPAIPRSAPPKARHYSSRC